MLTIKNTGLMKKIYLAMVVAATLASCNNDEIVNEAPKTPITFGNTFVENATRAIDNTYSNTNLFTSFKVYGAVKSSTIQNAQTVNIFKGVDVTSSNGVWSYNDTYKQYWVADCSYEFAAIVDGTVPENGYDANGMPTRITYDASGKKDLCYAETTADTGNDAVPTSGVNSEKKVNFTFNHLLSKAQFTAKNTISTNTENIKYTYQVRNVKITNAYKTATYTIETSSWGNHALDESYVVEFGNISNATSSNDPNNAISIKGNASATSHKQMLLIPYNYTSTNLTITFTVDLSLNGTLLHTKDYTKYASVNLEAGKAYNFVIKLGTPGQQINFTVETLTEWNPSTGGTDKPLTDISTSSTPGEGE